MSLNKIVLNICVISIAFFLFVLWYEKVEKEVVPTSSSPNQNEKIYLITTDKEYEYWNHIDDGAHDMADLTGFSYIWVAPKQRNTEQQIEVLNKAVSDGANAILIAVNDPQKLSEPIKKAKDQGVKFVYVDSPAIEQAVTTLATDNYEAGRTAGVNMLTQLDNSKIKSGVLGILGVSVNYDITMKREQGFREIIEADGRFKILDTIYTDGDPKASQQAAEEMIANYDNLVGLFGTNEGTTEGMGKAIEAKNNKIIGVGFDLTKINKALLNKGSINTLLVQNPYTMGYLGVAQAIAALKGFDTGPKFLNTGIKVMYSK
jgi:ABC-type sugar transport system, periplasmic component